MLMHMWLTKLFKKKKPEQEPKKLASEPQRPYSISQSARSQISDPDPIDMVVPLMILDSMHNSPMKVPESDFGGGFSGGGGSSRDYQAFEFQKIEPETHSSNFSHESSSSFESSYSFESSSSYSSGSSFDSGSSLDSDSSFDSGSSFGSSDD